MSLCLIADDLFRQGEHVRKVDPHWELVERCIRRLDGERFTEVFLADREDCGLLISGGWLTRYLCERLDVEANHTLIEPSRVGKPDMAVIFDGPPDFPAEYVVDLAAVLQATRHFMSARGLDPSLTWD
jgi:hypothetical protein